MDMFGCVLPTYDVAGMITPVLCRHCGKTYDLCSVTVIHRQDTKQSVVKIGLSKGPGKHHYDNALSCLAVKLLLPFIKPDEKGYKKIDIFDHSSMAGGVWLEVGKYIQIGRRHGEPTKFKTIEEAFKYIAHNFWYESTCGEDNTRDYEE